MSIDLLPSTGDGVKGEKDVVLSILKGARKRYKEGGTNGEYIEGRNVCAVGALAASVGVTSDNGDLSYMDGLIESIEKSLRESAKTAILLVEDAAVTLYPQTENKDDLDWGYSVEAINEIHNIIAPEPGPESPEEEDEWDYEAVWEKHWKHYNRKAVLACYDYAIALRTAAVHAETYEGI